VIIALSLAAIELCGCSDLTRVTNFNVLTPQEYDNPAGALLRLSGAVSSFTGALSLQGLYSGYLTDELTDLSGSVTADRRVVPEGQDVGFPYASLSAARLNALLAITTLQRYQPNLTSRVGELYAYAAYTELVLAEDMCSSVPTGVIINEQPAYGSTLSRSQLVQLAITHFDSASRYGADSTAITTMAQVGRARALLDSGDFAGASTVADSVAAGFVYSVTFAPSAQLANQIAAQVTQAKLTSVSDREGINGLDFVSAGDARLPIVDLGAGPGGEVFSDTNYSSLASPVALASGTEAQLIVAEAALQANNIATWSRTLNTLRLTAITPAMDTLTSDSTTAASMTEQQDVMFRERAFWLFGTGHRQGDLRRLVRQYGRTQGSVFPVGAYRGGPAQYGSDVTFTPVNENTNPNYHGCLDRNP
jgi:hypothetical protein